MNTTPTMFRALIALVRANVPVLIWDNPGKGKTAKIEAMFTALNYLVHTISASAHEAVDFMGLPMEKDGQVVHSPLAWAKRLAAATKGLLVIDEATTAQGSFKAFLRIVQERYVGELHLPDTVAVVGIANPPEVAVDGVDLPAPVANRFAHLDWYFDREEWLANVGTNFTEVTPPAPGQFLTEGVPADRARAVAMVTGFLRARPDYLNRMPQDPDAAAKAWPSARSWTNVIGALTFVPSGDEDVRDLIITACVGQAATVEFNAWLATADLADPAAVLAKPSIVRWSTERPDRVFALLNAVQTLATLEGDKGTWRQAMGVMVACADAGRADLAMPSARALANQDHAGGGIPDSFRAAFTDLFVRTHQVAVAA